MVTMILRPLFSKVLQTITKHRPDFANKVAVFLLDALKRSNSVSSTTKDNLVENFLTPGDIAEHYEAHKYLYVLLRTYKDMMAMYEKNNATFPKESYEDRKKKVASLNAIVLSSDRVVFPNGYVLFKKPLSVKDLYTETSGAMSGSFLAPNDPILVQKVSEFHPNARIATIQEYHHMMTFYPGTDSDKRELLMNAILGNKYDQIWLCAYLQDGSLWMEYGYSLPARGDIKLTKFDSIHDYLIIIPPK
jgi:hypothetical protein